MKTYAEIANNWQLWMDHVDPSATMSRDEFDALSINERIAMIVACFGEEVA